MRKIFSPLVRLGLLNWNPLESDCAEFESLTWFTDLMMYGVVAGEEDSEDPDNFLVPDLIEHILLVKLSGVLEFVWDPLSVRQTDRAVALLHQLMDDYPTVGADRETT